MDGVEGEAERPEEGSGGDSRGTCSRLQDVASRGETSDDNSDVCGLLRRMGESQSPHDVTHRRPDLRFLRFFLSFFVIPVSCLVSNRKHIAKQESLLQLLQRWSMWHAVGLLQLGEVEMGGRGSVAENELVVYVAGQTAAVGSLDGPCVKENYTPKLTVVNVRMEGVEESTSICQLHSLPVDAKGLGARCILGMQSVQRPLSC